MNDALYLTLLKQDGKKLMGCSAGIILYQWLLTWVYPILIKSPAIGELTKGFPSEIKKAFGVSAGEEIDLSYEAYISAQFTGRIWSLLLAIYGVYGVKSLLVEPIEQGVMVFPLSAPLTRSEIFNSCISAYLTQLGLINSAQWVGILAATAFFDIDIDRWKYFKLSISAASLGAVIVSYCFFLAVAATDTKAFGYTGAITFLLYGLSIASSISKNYNWLKYVTPFTLYRSQDILQGKADSAKEILGGVAITAIFFNWAAKLFAVRDFLV